MDFQWTVEPGIYHPVLPNVLVIIANMNSCFLCAKGFIYIFSLNPHNNPSKQGTVFPFYRWWNCGLERSKNLYKAPQPMESQDSHFKWCLSGGSGFFCKLKIWHGQGSKSNSSQMPSPLLQRIVSSPFFTEPPPGDAERRERLVEKLEKGGD